MLNGPAAGPRRVVVPLGGQGVPGLKKHLPDARPEAPVLPVAPAAGVVRAAPTGPWLDPPAPAQVADLRRKWSRVDVARGRSFATPVLAVGPMDVVPCEAPYGPRPRVAVPETRLFLRPPIPGLLPPIAQVARRVEGSVGNAVAVAALARRLLPRKAEGALGPGETLHVEAPARSSTADPGALEDKGTREVGGPLVARHRLLEVATPRAHLRGDSEVAGTPFSEAAVPAIVEVPAVAVASARAASTAGGRPAGGEAGARHVTVQVFRTATAAAAPARSREGVAARSGSFGVARLA